MLLRHINEPAAADRLQAAITRIIAEGTLTPDLGGSANTVQVRDRVIELLGN
jgi:tartrate dehydrogenase/decarboxylase/D-malate dehydrogenase